MKVLMCENCNKKQSSGKFCLDCGQPLKEVITGDVTFKPIDTGRSSDKLKSDIRKWLGRIGVQQPDIIIHADGHSGVATVEYVLKNNTFSFTSVLQRNVSNNLAAVEQFLHHRVIGIERGIESVERAFAGYESLPDYTSETGSFDPYVALGFEGPVSLEAARSKYKELVKKYHPDVNPNKNTQAEFERIKKAMDILEMKEDE